MEIHNLMEELVRSLVDEVSRDDEERPTRHYCTSDECRTDAICYVLNRLPGRYVSSGRGYAHLTEELKQDHQLGIDVLRLVHEGLGRVSATRRAFYDGGDSSPADGPVFNFPTIKGRLLDGLQFFPVTHVEVELLIDGARCEMYDHRWNNPYEIADQTPGTFIFWPAPRPAAAAGESRSWSCELQVTDSRFESFRHWFTIDLTSEAEPTRRFGLDRDFRLPDLYLFAR